MGELGANFCRNDFLKSKLNEMDFSSFIKDFLSNLLLSFLQSVFQGYILYNVHHFG